MRGFDIGERVIVRAVTTLQYDLDNNRFAQREEIVPMDAAITGRTVRFLGKYHRSHGGDGWGEDYTPAELAVSGSIEFWCVRFGMLNKEHWVADADLEPGSIRPYHGTTFFKLPRRAPRIVYVASPESPVTVTSHGPPKLITFKEPILLT